MLRQEPFCLFSNLRSILLSPWRSPLARPRSARSPLALVRARVRSPSFRAVRAKLSICDHNFLEMRWPLLLRTDASSATLFQLAVRGRARRAFLRECRETLKTTLSLNFLGEIKNGEFLFVF